MPLVSAGLVVKLTWVPGLAPVMVPPKLTRPPAAVWPMLAAVRVRLPPEPWNTLPKMPNGAMGTMKMSPYTSRSLKRSDRLSAKRYGAPDSKYRRVRRNVSSNRRAGLGATNECSASLKRPSAFERAYVRSISRCVRVGDSEESVRSAYAERVTTTPHKYDPSGHNLTVTPASAADSMFRIVFETNGQRVIRFRAGRLPAVQYVEGCG